MEIKFNRTGAERKSLVEAIGSIVGVKPVYMNVPTFAYVVSNYTIDRDGTLTFDQRTDLEEVRTLLTALEEQGFMPTEPFEAVTDDRFIGKLSIDVPLDGFSDTALSNLEKLVQSKAPLIKKAIGTDDLPIVQTEERLCFPWFDSDSSAAQVLAYTLFIHALCEMAQTQKRVTAKQQPVESEKYAFRCFLLRLGFIGKEFAQARRILLANLSGNGSFRKQS